AAGGASRFDRTINRTPATELKWTGRDVRIRLSIDDPAAARRAGRAVVAKRRRRLLIAIARRALARLIERTPVETGRLRAAWSEALADLGDEIPTGSAGRHGEGAAQTHDT